MRWNVIFHIPQWFEIRVVFLLSCAVKVEGHTPSFTLFDNHVCQYRENNGAVCPMLVIGISPMILLKIPCGATPPLNRMKDVLVYHYTQDTDYIILSNLSAINLFIFESVEFKHFVLLMHQQFFECFLFILTAKQILKITVF